MFATKRIEGKKSNAYSIEKDLDDFFKKANENNWEIINITSFDTKIWDYPSHYEGICYLIIFKR